MMDFKFPAAVPEVPVRNVDEAATYYVRNLGFTHDWGDDAGGIAGISKGDCRLFLANDAFRQAHGNSSPVLIWLNLGSREQVDELHRSWNGRGANIVSRPETKPWNLHEFTAVDLDGNLLRVFYDFAWEAAEAP
jgi:predicted lactoylglutathione lyase